jgi:hypothetical protein
MCDLNIDINSMYACKKINIYQLWDNIVTNSWLVCIVLIVFGVFFCFFGQRYIKITEVLTGVLVTWFFLVYILFTSLSPDFNSVGFWLIIIFTIIIGLVVGYFIAKIEWIPTLILGGMLGFVIGCVLYQLALKYIASHPDVVFWVTVSVLMAGGMLAGWKKPLPINILSTSFIGSYAIIRGFSSVLGHFPSEHDIINTLLDKDYQTASGMFTWQVYVYLAFFIVIGIAGIIVQYKLYRNRMNEMKEEVNDFKKGEFAAGIRQGDIDCIEDETIDDENVTLVVKKKN